MKTFVSKRAIIAKARIYSIQSGKDILDMNVHKTGNYILYGTRCEKKLTLSHANNKGADQPAHPRSLISPFVVR